MSRLPKTSAQHTYFPNVQFSFPQTIRTTEYKMKLKQTGTALPNCGLKSAEACGAVERGVWALMSARAPSLCVRGVNGPTQGHSWALCSVSAGALKVEDYATSCDQTDASDKTHHTNRDSSSPAVGPHSEPRWRRAATLFSVSHLHPHTYAPQSIRHTDKGGRAAHLGQATWASGQPWAILYKHKLMKHTLSPCAVAQNTETLKWL